MITEQNIHQILDEAIQAGELAHINATPTPMTVVGGGQQYYVSEGACGFAWVSVYGIKGNTRIGKILKARGFRKAYEGGLQYWVSTMTQSVDRKEAYATAMAEVLRKHGMTAYMNSRMD